MNQTLDFYCERCDVGFWAEPINATSNLAFWVAAAMAFRVARRDRKWVAPVQVLVVLATIVGVGSFLFHTFATRWANLADIIPIFAFELFVLAWYLVRIVSVGAMATACVCLTMLAISVGMLGYPHFANGSLMYAPTWVAIALMNIYHLMFDKTGLRWAVMLLVAFTVSLCFRTVDMAICDVFPIGTHFVWHLCNGVVLYAAMRLVIDNVPGKLEPNRSQAGA